MCVLRMNIIMKLKMREERVVNGEEEERNGMDENYGDDDFYFDILTNDPTSEEEKEELGDDWVTSDRYGLAMAW